MSNSDTAHFKSNQNLTNVIMSKIQTTIRSKDHRHMVENDGGHSQQSLDLLPGKK